MLNDLCKGVEYGPNYVKYLEMDKIAALRTAQFEGYMTISTRAKRELLWWKQNLAKSFKNIRNSAPTITITTDASLSGWGAVFEGRSTGGIWSANEKTHHINVLERMAVFLGLKSFLKNSNNVSIRVLTDNTNTAAYINHMGGTKSEQCNYVYGMGVE